MFNPKNAIAFFVQRTAHFLIDISYCNYSKIYDENLITSRRQSNLKREIPRGVYPEHKKTRFFPFASLRVRMTCEGIRITSVGILLRK
ncbi:MAG: hypothetical protein HZA00_00965 [Nitrospinae bacterium]|nr:hypothetical protein [Nitrospinota bacterium]